MADWGTDVEFDNTDSLSGGGSLKFLGTTPIADPYILSEWIAVDRGVAASPPYYAVTATVKASSSASANYVQVDLLEYDRDRSTLLATTSAFNNSTATTSWETIGAVLKPANASTLWMRARITKKNTAFTLNVDRVDVKKQPPYCFMELSSDQTVAVGGAWEALGFDTADSAGADGETSGSDQGEVIIRRSQLYHVKAVVLPGGLSGTDAVDYRIVHSDFQPATGALVSYYYFGTGTHSTMEWSATGAFTFPMEASDRVWIEYNVATAGGGQVIVGGIDPSFNYLSVTGVY